MMKFTSDNEVDICEAERITWLPALKEKFPDDYLWLIGFIVPIVNRERTKSIKLVNHMRDTQ